MTHNSACTAIPDQTPERLVFLSSFAESLATESDEASLSGSILRTFSRLGHPTFIALWMVDDRNQDYRLAGCLGSVPAELPASFSGSDPVALMLPTVSTVLWRDEFVSLGLETGGGIRRLFDAGSADLVVSMTHQGRLLGFCGLRLEYRGCGVEDAALAPLLRLAAQMSASAIQQRRQHADRRQSHALLRRTDRLRSLEVIAGALAHEIRNPLTSIKTFVQLAPGRRLDARFMEEFSQVAVDDIHRIEHLLQEILDYARYLVPTPADENVNELALSCLSFVSLKASDRSIRLRSEFAEGLPFVLLDRQQIKQVIINLLLNAVDACRTQGREIVVRTWMEQQPAGRPSVFIEVQDDGEGIAPEHLEHIFDPFFTTKHSNSMTEIRGLGLTIAHQIVHEHQGAITVESRQGVGSTFRVSLPVQASPADGTFIRE